MKSREILFVGIFLLLTSFVVRLPYFFPAVLDWDESTFILMGQSVLDGHLPYTELWDNKPPLIFYIIASFLFFFGKSIVSVRIGATICVALVALFLYMIARRFLNRIPSIFASLLYVFGASFVLSGQSALSEHLALAFLIPAIYLYYTRVKDLLKYFLMGLLAASASYIRTNMGIVCVAMGLYIFLSFLIRGRLRKMLIGILGYALGICLVTLAMVIPYFIAGQTGVLWPSLVKAPIAYSSSQYSFLQMFFLHYRFIYLNLIHPRPVNILTVITVITGISGFVLLFIKWKTYEKAIQWNWIFLFVNFIAAYLSLLLGGAFWPEYFIQLIPFLSLSTAFLVSRIRKVHLEVAVLIIFIGLFGYSSKHLLSEYRKLIHRFLTNEKLEYGPAYEIKSYLEENKLGPEQVFLMTEHIVYWLMEGKPLVREATHPSNIHLEYLLRQISSPETTPLMTMQKILMKDPEIIVIPDIPIYYVDPKADSLLKTTLKEKYMLAKVIQEPMQKTLIYRRMHEMKQ
jgi:4-amino-4-deoxy-L-arabinose transferase-like glycosyltransferase